MGSLLAVKQLAKCVLTVAGAGTRPGGFSGGAGVTHEPGVARRNLGPVLLHERRPDGLFETPCVEMVWSSRPQAESRPGVTEGGVR